jgi:hypothetical protein
MQAPLQPGQLEPVAGLFRLSFLLHAAVRLRIAEALAEGPCSAEVLAEHAHTHRSTTTAFLDALTAWGVLARDEGGRYRLTPVSRRLLPDEAGGLNLRLVAGWTGLDAVLDAWCGLEHTLRTGESGLNRGGSGGFHARLADDAVASARYQAAMASTLEAFSACAAALDDVPARLIVDIGGGRGEMLASLLARRPDSHGICVDMPHVVQRLVPQLQGRLRFVGADARRHVPPGADLYLMSTVLRCFDDDGALAMLRATRRAMTLPAVRLVCFEMVAPDDRSDPMLALADMTARVVYGGRDRTGAEFEALLARAGFACDEIRRVDGALHAITARRVALQDTAPERVEACASA